MIFSVFTVHKIQFILKMYILSHFPRMTEVRVQSLDQVKPVPSPKQTPTPSLYQIGTSHRSKIFRQVPPGKLGEIITILLHILSGLHLVHISQVLRARGQVWESQCLQMNPCPSLLPFIITGLYLNMRQEQYFDHIPFTQSNILYRDPELYDSPLSYSIKTRKERRQGGSLLSPKVVQLTHTK